MSTVESTATTSTSGPSTSFTTKDVPGFDLHFNPFEDYAEGPDDVILGKASTTEFVNTYSQKVERLDLFFNPNLSSAANKSDIFTKADSEGGFTYEGFKITRAVSVPCLFLMLVSSILLVYIILKHLKGILYLYISVLFYAFTQVFTSIFTMAKFQVFCQSVKFDVP